MLPASFPVKMYLIPLFNFPLNSKTVCQFLDNFRNNSDLRIGMIVDMDQGHYCSLNVFFLKQFEPNYYQI